MFGRLRAWFTRVEDVPVPVDEVAAANEALWAVTERLPVVLGED